MFRLLLKMYIYFIVFISTKLVISNYTPFMGIYNLPKLYKLNCVYLKWVYFIVYKFS